MKFKKGKNLRKKHKHSTARHKQMIHYRSNNLALMAEQKTICGLYVNSDNWTNWDLQIVTCPYCLQEIEEYKRKYSDWFSKAKTPVNWENIFSPSEDKDKYPEPYKTKW